MIAHGPRALAPAVLSIGLCWLVACANPTPEMPSPPPDDSTPYAWTHSTEELDILEATLRYFFENNASSNTNLGRGDFLFVALGEGEAGVDPSPQLLARFADHAPPVMPASLMEMSGGGVKHKDRGGNGTLFHIDRIRPADDNTVDVDCGYWEADLSASGNSYRLKKHGGSWVVVGGGMWWIS